MKRRNAKRSGVRWLLAFALAVFTTATLSAVTPPSAVGAENKRFKVQWVGRHREVTTEFRNASATLEEAELNHRTARKRNRLKGERRVELNEALEAAQIRFDAAKKAKDEFPEQARRAGAPPGWFD